MYAKAPPSELEGPIQVSQEEAEEYAFAPVMVALRAMEQARPVLTMSMDKQARSESSGVLSMFISPPKVDGLGVEKSLIRILR